MVTKEEKKAQVIQAMLAMDRMALIHDSGFGPSDIARMVNQSWCLHTKDRFGIPLNRKDPDSGHVIPILRELIKDGRVVCVPHPVYPNSAKHLYKLSASQGTVK